MNIPFLDSRGTSIITITKGAKKRAKYILWFIIIAELLSNLASCSMAINELGGFMILGQTNVCSTNLAAPLDKYLTQDMSLHSYPIFGTLY